MTIDALAFEPQFQHHLAPVWDSLPQSARGRFRVAAGLPGDDTVDVMALMTEIPVAPKANLGPGPVALVASAGDIKVGRRLGYRRFAFLEHGAGQSYGGHPTDARHGSYPGGPDREDVGLFMVPNTYAGDRWRATYPKATVVEVGCPKLDTLPRREPGPGPVICVSFHWPAPLAISGYAGTAIGDFLPQLAKVAAAFSTIGHCHPKGDWPVRMARQYARLGIPFVPDFADVCRQADVYVCDNSSTIAEFAATGRPVVLLNARSWHRQHSVGGRFWDWSGLGINVGPDDDLVAAIWRTIETEGPVMQRFRAELLERHVYQPSLTGGAQRAAAAVLAWLDVIEGVDAA